MFSDFEHDLDNNMLDLYFLNEYHSELYFHLNGLFHVKKDCICCFLHQEYEYKERLDVRGSLGRFFYRQH